MKTKIVLLVFVLVGLASKAPEAATGSSMRVPVDAAAALFAVEGVAAEIGLDATQRAESARLAKKYEENQQEHGLAMFWAVYRKDEKRKAELEKTKGDIDRPLATFLETLQPAQRARLGELFVQWVGADAVFNEDVQQALNLTPAQKREAAEIDKAITAEVDRFTKQIVDDGSRALLAQQKEGVKAKEAWEKAKAEKTAAHEKAVAELRAKRDRILNSKQKQQLEKLKGRPFSFRRI